MAEGPEETLEQWLKEELDDLSHRHGFTCDRHGDIARGRRDARRGALAEVAEYVGLGYEHDPETCEQCAAEREMIGEIGHWGEDKIEERLEEHGI